MDNPTSESSALDTNQAAEVFASMLSPEPVKEHSEAAQESPEAAAERLAAEELQANESTPDSEQSEESPKFTVKIDGKDVEVSLDELRNGYQRQADYTRKTMEASELRKQAEAEAVAARQERQQYAQNLQALSQQLQGALQEQSNINWQQLLETDPTEYLRQKHLYEQRQAAFQTTQQEQARLYQQQQAEQVNQVKAYLAQQQEQLLAKFPDWKDEAKAKAEKANLVAFMVNDLGFSPQEVQGQMDANGNLISLGIADHRYVVMARDAMKYRELMAKAQAGLKKAEKAPPKVERPGAGEVSKPDGRTAAMQRLSRSGRVEDAAAVFAQFL